MRVIYHHRTAGDRVEAVHIMGMVCALRDLGHSVEICSPPGCDPERRGAASVPVSGDAPHEGPLRSLLKRMAQRAPPVFFEVLELGYNLFSLADMLRRFVRRRPDLVYERTTSNSIAPTLLAGLWRIPVVQEVNVTSEIGRLRPLALRRTTRAIERWMVARAGLVATVSEAFKRMLVNAGWPAEKMLVLQNAIDPAAFDPDTVRSVPPPVKLGDGAVVVGYVGAFVPYHRLDMLVETARELSDAHPRAAWLLVGDGVDRPRIEELIGRYGLGDRFWLPGRVAHDRVPCYAGAMDIAVLPNSEAYNSPMKLFEYMAMARPVVAPAVPAIAEVIRHGETGLLFEPGNGDEFRRAVELLLDDADLRRRMGRNARRCVMENHTWLRNAERLLAALGDHGHMQGKV